MAASKEIAIILTLKDKATKQMAAASGKLKTGLRSLGQGYQELSRLGIGMTAVSAGMAVGLAKVVQGADKAAFAQKRLQAMLNNVKKEQDKNTESLLKQADAYEELLGIEAEEVITVQTMLASFQLTKKQIEEATPRVLDIAAAVADAEGRAADYKQTAIALGKALNGNVGVLSKMGIVLSEETMKTKEFGAVMQDVDANAKNAAKALADTLGSDLKKLKNAFGMVTDEIGAQLIPALRSVLAAITPLIRKLSEMPEPLKKIIALGGIAATALTGLAGGAMTAVGGVGFLVNQITELTTKFPVLLTLLSKAGAAIQLFGMKILAATPIIAAGAAAIILLHQTFKQWNAMKDAQEAAEDMDVFKKQAVNAGKKVVESADALRKLQESGKASGDEIEKAKEKLKRWIHESDVMHDKMGTARVAWDEYRRMVIETNNVEQMSLDLKKRYYAAIGKEKDVALIGMEEELAELKALGLSEEKLAEARAAMTAAIEEDFKDVGTAIRSIAPDIDAVNERVLATLGGIRGIGGAFSELEAQMKEFSESQKEIPKTVAEQYESNAEFIKAKVDEMADAEGSRIQAMQEAWESAADAGTSALGGMFSEMIEKGKEFELTGKKMVGIVLQMAAAAIPSIPGLGIGQGFLGSLLGGLFKQGGRIPHAQGGLRLEPDAVPVIAHRGEGVVSKQGMTMLDRAFGKGGTDSILRGAGMPGGGQSVIHNHFHIASYDKDGLLAQLRSGELGRAFYQATQQGAKIVHSRGVA